MFLWNAPTRNVSLESRDADNGYLSSPSQHPATSSRGNYVPFNLRKDDFTSPDGVKFPDLKRSYYALDLYLEHHFADDWYGRIDYTFSRSYGNSEGQLKSDIGQLDPSVTQDWDAPEIMQYANV